MLHPVAELAEHGIGDVERILRDEVHADALGADQPHHLLDLLEQRRRRIVEQQVRLVEEEHQLGLVEVADLGQLLEQLGQQPEQEGRVQPRRVHQLVGGQNVDHAPAVGVGLHQVVEVQHRLAEEACRRPARSSASSPRWIAPIDAADTLPYSVVNSFAFSPTYCSIARRSFRSSSSRPCSSAILNTSVQHARLGLVQIQHPRQQQRPHVRDRRAHRMALLAEDVPERDRAAAGTRHPRCRASRAAPSASAFRLPGCARPERSPFTSAMNTGTPMRREPFGEHLQGDGLAGAGGAGDQAVPVGERRQQAQFGLAATSRSSWVQPW